MPQFGVCALSRQRGGSGPPFHDTSMTFIVEHRCTYPGLVFIKADEPQISEQGGHEEVQLAALYAALTCRLLGDTRKKKPGFVSRRSNAVNLPNPAAELAINRVCSRLHP